MNEFTKEELRIISQCCSHVAMDGWGNVPVNLIEKIASMINNHPKCDHRSGMDHYNEKGESVGYETDIFRCRHCDILFKFLYENGICVGHEELE